jgi:hypothetical protein
VTKWILFRAMGSHAGDDSFITLPDGTKGYIVSVEREDGSGHCFNVTVMFMEGEDFGKRKTVFVRTID